MLKIALTQLDSGRHDPAVFARDRAEFLTGLSREFTLIASRSGEEVEADLRVVFIASGGSEDAFRRHFPRLPKPLILLADGKHNSLAAALEISAWVRRQGESAEIVHGDSASIASRLRRLADFHRTRRALAGPIGMIGEPSDWLIASMLDHGAVRQRWGTEFLNISLSEVTAPPLDDSEAAAIANEFNAGAAALDGVDHAALLNAARLFPALKAIFARHRLRAATVRCFSLIEPLRSSACLALSRLNDMGLISGCEGDAPAVFSMLLLFVLTGEIPFMANPASVDIENNRLLLAHCSVPRRAVSGYRLQTHFETGIGVGVSGDFVPGPATVFKAGNAGLDSYFVSGAQVLPSPPAPGLCRTQVWLQLQEPAGYFLHSPLANHHILIHGDHAALVDEFMLHCGATRSR